MKTSLYTKMTSRNTTTTTRRRRTMTATPNSISTGRRNMSSLSSFLQWRSSFIMTTRLLLLLLSALVSVVRAGNDYSDGRASTAYPFQNPCVSAQSMYYEDSSYVLKDLKAGRFSKLYIKFHNCAWSPTEVIRPEYWTGHTMNGEEEEEAEGDVEDRRRTRDRTRQLGGDGDWKYYQCGYNHGEDHWQTDWKPCLNANVAYSLYGVYSSLSGRLSGAGSGGCSSGTYINTFFTTDGLWTFLQSLQLDLSEYTSYYGAISNTTGYYTDAYSNYEQDNANGEEEEEAEDEREEDNKDNDKFVMQGYYEDNIQKNFNEGEYLGLNRNNYYGSEGYDEYNQYSPILQYYDQPQYQWGGGSRSHSGSGDHRERVLEEDNQEDQGANNGAEEAEADVDAYYNDEDNNDGDNDEDDVEEEEEHEEEVNPDQMIPFVSNGGTCRNRVKYGYSLGIGCDSSNQQKFTIDLFDGYYCDATFFKQTVNSLQNFNQAILSTAGQCLEIYRNTNPFSSNADVDYASALLKHSKSCDPNQYGHEICPDPYGKKKECTDMMYWKERGLYNIKSSKELQKRYVASIIMILLALLFIVLAMTSNKKILQKWNTWAIKLGLRQVDEKDLDRACHAASNFHCGDNDADLEEPTKKDIELTSSTDSEESSDSSKDNKFDNTLERQLTSVPTSEGFETSQQTAAASVAPSTTSSTKSKRGTYKKLPAPPSRSALKK